MTNTDLKQISKLFDTKLEPIQGELKKHGGLLEKQGKLLRSLKKDQKTMLNLLDQEQMTQRKRLKRVEEHLNISSSTA